MLTRPSLCVYVCKGTLIVYVLCVKLYVIIVFGGMLTLLIDDVIFIITVKCKETVHNVNLYIRMIVNNE